MEIFLARKDATILLMATSKLGRSPPAASNYEKKVGLTPGSGVIGWTGMVANATHIVSQLRKPISA